MWTVHVICSGRDCDQELELILGELGELERAGCECGHTLVVLSVSEVELLTP